MWTAGDAAANAPAINSGSQARFRASGIPHGAFVVPTTMAEPSHQPDVVMICSDIPGPGYWFPVLGVFVDGSTRLIEEWKPYPPETHAGPFHAGPTWAVDKNLWSY